MHSEVTRRSFLAAAAAAVMARRVFARTDDKSGLTNPVLGEGEHRYECIHDWLKPPQRLLFGDTHGLAQDAAGRIYVAQTVHSTSTKGEAVAVYGADGKFIGAWGDRYRGGAHGLDVRSEPGAKPGDKPAEFLYHCDTNRRVVEKTDLNGEVVWSKGYPVEASVYPAKEKYCPTNVAFLPDEDGKAGDILVGDGYGSSYIHRFTAAGDFVRTVVQPGKEEGKVNCPHGLWVDSRSGTPRIAVADRGNRRIQYFTLDGRHDGFVTAGMRQPCHFKTRGDLLLVPDLSSVVTLLGKDNKVVAHLGDGHPSPLRDKPREQFIPGKFIHPHTAIFLNNGDILVAEWVPIGRVTLLRKVS
ncbi:MAG TPA: hypothetical protein VFF65_11165 [Phycisphaerales bacterium]|nr:hypothetical protein [Phycisphaerales bacterium]